MERIKKERKRGKEERGKGQVQTNSVRKNICQSCGAIVTGEERKKGDTKLATEKIS